MVYIIQTGGKQYKVVPGDVIRVEKLVANEGDTVELDVLMTIEDGKVQVGTPYLDAKLQAKVLGHGKAEKILVFHYKPKKDYRKKSGHRQPYTELEILDAAKAAPKRARKPKAEEAAVADTAVIETAETPEV